MQQKKITVLIADDHPMLCLGVETLLKREADLDYVGKAGSSEELFEILPEASPDVLLLDLNMPGADYTRNIERLCKEYPKLRILVYSGYNGQDITKSLLESGVDGYLSKGTSGDLLIEGIKAVADGRNFVREEKKKLPKKAKRISSSILLTDNFQKRMCLSKREQEILVLISKGLTSQRIGNTLYISKYTVETHRKNILRKLELNSSTELVKFAIQQGLV